MPDSEHDGHDDTLHRLVSAADQPARRLVIFEAMFQELMGLLAQPGSADRADRESITNAALAAYLGMNVSSVAVALERVAERLDSLERAVGRLVSAAQAEALTQSVVERLAAPEDPS